MYHLIALANATYINFLVEKLFLHQGKKDGVAVQYFY